MDGARDVADEAIQWHREKFHQFRSYTERDVGWTVQTRIRTILDEREPNLSVFNDPPARPGNRRARSADLALAQPSGEVDLTIEFKYEPDHRREDIPKSKLPIVEWGADWVSKDIDRIREMVTSNRVKAAWPLFIDEGGYFCHRAPHAGSEWIRCPRIRRGSPLRLDVANASRRRVRSLRRGCGLG